MRGRSWRPFLAGLLLAAGPALAGGRPARAQLIEADEPLIVPPGFVVPPGLVNPVLAPAVPVAPAAPPAGAGLVPLAPRPVRVTDFRSAPPTFPLFGPDGGSWGPQPTYFDWYHPNPIWNYPYFTHFYGRPF